MAGFMQVSGRDIRDKTITDDDISDVANIAISKISGLQTALDGKAASPVSASSVSLNTTNFNKNLSSSETNVQLALDKLDDMSLGGDTVIIQTLSADKTLTATSEKIQILNPNGANRKITLPTSGLTTGQSFIIRNNAAYNTTFYLDVWLSGASVDYIYAGREEKFIWDGAAYIKDLSNIAIGRKSNAVGYATALGEYASAVSGTAIGRFSSSQDGGACIGQSGNAGYYSIAILGNNKDKSDCIALKTTNNRIRDFAFATATPAHSGWRTFDINDISLNSVWIQILGFSGSAYAFTIIPNSTLIFNILVQIRNRTTYEMKAWEIKGAIRRTDGAPTMVGTPTKTILAADTSMNDCDVRVSANSNDNSLELEIYGINNLQVRCGGHVHYNEIAI